MHKDKIIDCITFFDNNFMFDLRYNILKDYVDYFVICESKFNHKGIEKKQNFLWNKDYDKKKIRYLFSETPFPKHNNGWENQAIQREILLKLTDFADQEDYIFFSDPDEIPNPKFFKNFNLKEKYGIFLQDCFNYKFNLFNPFESPWEGTRVAKKKNIRSLDFMRQKIKTKNLSYPFWRFDKEKNIQIFNNGGWHFNNILSAEEISVKLKTFAHSEFSTKEYSDVDLIKKKIDKKIDLFNRGHNYSAKSLDESFPEYLKKNREKYVNWII